jgi:hypothetical protein
MRTSSQIPIGPKSLLTLGMFIIVGLFLADKPYGILINLGSNLIEISIPPQLCNILRRLSGTVRSWSRI